MATPSTFSKFGKGKTPEVEAPAAPPVPPKTALSIFGKATAESALMAVTEDQGGGQQSPFPVIEVTGGNTGGLFSAVKGTADQELLDQLPQGGKPVKGIFLAYRTELTSWPEGYNEGAENKPKPCWASTIPSGAAGDAQLANKACEAYQFTKKDEKVKFDYATSEIGHVRPTFQMLVFLAEINDVVVVALPGYFSSWVETQKSLRLLVDPETRQLSQFPCCIRVVSKEVSNKAKTQTWMVHHCDVTQAVDNQTKAAWEKYQPWVEALQSAPEKMALFQEWLDGADKPMTDVHRAALRKASVI